MVANSACTVYRVTTIKRGVLTHVAVDGGMGDNLEVSLTGQRFEATIVNRVGGGEMVSVVGRHCESGDQLVDGVAAARSRGRRSARRAGHRRLLLHDVQPVQRRAPRPGGVRPQRECAAGGSPRHLGRPVDARCRLTAGKMAGMTDLPELAGRVGAPLRRRNRIRGLDRQARTVAESTLVAVLDALGVPAATEDERTAALAAHDRDYWARSLPPAIVGRSGATSSFWVHVTHGDPARLWIRLEDGSVRTGLRQLENNRAPYDLDGRLVGEATLRTARRPAAGISRAAPSGRLVRHQHPRRRLPRVAGAARPAGPKPGMGPGHPAVQRPLAKILGHRRFDGSDRPRGVVGGPARRGFHSGQPAARRRADRADGAVAVPADLAPVRQPAVPAGGGDPRVRLRPAPRPHPQGPRSMRRHAPSKSKLIDRDAAWKVKRAALESRVPRRAIGGPGTGVRRLPRAARAAASTTSRPGARWPRSTAATGTSGPTSCSIRRARRSPNSPPSTPTTVDFHRWLQWQLDDQLTAAQATRCPGGHGAGHHARPRGRRGPQRRRCVGAAGRAGARRHRGRAARRVQPARPGLVAAAVAARSTGRTRHTSRSAPWSTRCCGMRAASASTTSSGCSGCGGSRRASPPTEGTYVRYDHEAMIGIVALEAHRAGAVVVGEDLGTVEPWVRDYLRERGLFGTSILWFELDRDGDGGPLPAERWREYCLSSVTTHDLPPTAGYLAGEHVRLREELGLLTRSGRGGTGRRPAPAGGLAGRTAPRRAAGRRPRRHRGRSGGQRAVPVSGPDAVAAAGAVAGRRRRRPAHPEPAGHHRRIPELAGAAERAQTARKLLLEDVFTDPRAAALAEAMRIAVNPPV